MDVIQLITDHRVDIKHTSNYVLARCIGQANWIRGNDITHVVEAAIIEANKNEHQ